MDEWNLVSKTNDGMRALCALIGAGLLSPGLNALDVQPPVRDTLGHAAEADESTDEGGVRVTPKKTATDDIAAQLEALRAQILHHDHLYYNEGQIEVSDAEYDALYRELKALEAEHPDLVTPDSPTQRVGAPLPLGDSFEKVRHAVPMLSIESLRTAEEARDFAAKVHRYLGVDAGEALVWHVEPKFDGVSAALTYVDGVFVQGLTRGDGATGEDITANLKTIRDVPMVLGLAAPPSVVEVRGEVLIARDRFERFNVWRAENGSATLANARNATAGALRRSDPAEVRRYPLEFHAYAIVRCEGYELPTSHAAQLKVLETWGFSETKEDETVIGIEACLAYHARLEAKRDEIPFEMDGVVAKLDDVELRARMGSTARATKWQYAQKFAPVEVTTILRAIEIQVGVNGRLTPRAHVDPVEVLGVTVRHATLHNEDYVLNMGVRPGDRVIVKRAGDVIPQIVGVAQPAPKTASKSGSKSGPKGWDDDIPASLRNADGSIRAAAIVAYAQDFAMPAVCPACETEVVREGKYVRCPNVYGCRPQLIGRTAHMAGRSGFDIDALGEKMIVQLFEAGHLHTPADLFALRDVPDEDLIAIERWGQKTVENLKRELDEARKVPLARFLAALSIPEVGGATARLLARNFDTLDEVQGATIEQLIVVDGIGEEVAGRISAWFEEPRNVELLASLARNGVEIVAEEPASGGGEAFADAVVVFTGTLEGMTRFEAKKAVEAQGGRVGSSVSKKTDFLVVGGKPGSKAKKAEALGVTVLLEEAFLARLAGEVPDTSPESEAEPAAEPAKDDRGE